MLLKLLKSVGAQKDTYTMKEVSLIRVNEIINALQVTYNCGEKLAIWDFSIIILSIVSFGL